MAEIGDIWFRYYDGQSKIALAELTIIKVTAKCVFVYESPGDKQFWDLAHFIKHSRRVLKEARKRYCYPTKELAAESFRIRKQFQERYLTANLEKCKMMLRLAGISGDIPEIEDAPAGSFLFRIQSHG